MQSHEDRCSHQDTRDGLSNINYSEGGKGWNQYFSHNNIKSLPSFYNHRPQSHSIDKGQNNELDIHKGIDDLQNKDKLTVWTSCDTDTWNVHKVLELVEGDVIGVDSAAGDAI